MENLKQKLFVLLWVGFVALIGNTINSGVPLKLSIIGMLILVAITMLGIIMKKIIPLKLPVVFWVSIIAILLTSPVDPYGAYIDANYLSKIGMLPLTTPVLAFAGLSLGKDLKLFKELSWKIVIVAITVYTGTFIFATIIAEVVLRLDHFI
jgi:Na+/citrate or Na+/malate symporter